MKGRGIELILKSMRYVKDNNVVYAFLGYGEEDYVKMMNQYAKEFKDRIFILDPIPEDQIVPTIEKFSASFALIDPVSKNHELSLSNKFFQSICAGVPLILGPHSIVMNAFAEKMKAGIIMNSYSPEELANVVDNIATGEIAFDREDIKRKSMETFSWDIEKKKLVEIIRGLK